MSKGFGSVPQVLVNGVQLELEEEDLESALVTLMQQQTYEIQQAIFTVHNKYMYNTHMYMCEYMHTYMLVVACIVYVTYIHAYTHMAYMCMHNTCTCVIHVHA